MRVLSLLAAGLAAYSATDLDADVDSDLTFLRALASNATVNTTTLVVTTTTASSNASNATTTTATPTTTTASSQSDSNATTTTASSSTETTTTASSSTETTTTAASQEGGDTTTTAASQEGGDTTTTKAATAGNNTSTVTVKPPDDVPEVTGSGVTLAKPTGDKFKPVTFASAAASGNGTTGAPPAKKKITQTMTAKIPVPAAILEDTDKKVEFMGAISQAFGQSTCELGLVDAFNARYGDAGLGMCVPKRVMDTYPSGKSRGDWSCMSNHKDAVMVLEACTQIKARRRRTSLAETRKLNTETEFASSAEVEMEEAAADAVTNNIKEAVDATDASTMTQLLKKNMDTALDDASNRQGAKLQATEVQAAKTAVGNMTATVAAPTAAIVTTGGSGGGSTTSGAAVVSAGLALASMLVYAIA